MSEEPDDPDRTQTGRGDAPATPFPVTTGKTLAGYTLTRELGRGGMGVVYEALEPESGRTIALKVIEPSRSGYDVDRALREARMMAKVAHPHTVLLYRAERTRSGLLLAMELVPGGTLADLLATEGRLPASRAVAIALQLIEGLKSYDAHGIVHRDIKPANCFLTAEGLAKVGDLGLSISRETVGRRTESGHFAGTVHYSSPEQLRGEPLDRRSDIYSLGATLYEMLSGRPPIQTPDRITLVARVISEEPERLADLVPDLPRRLEKVVRVALAKRPGQRYSGYDDFARALQPFASQAAPSGWATRIGSRTLALFSDVVIAVWAVHVALAVLALWVEPASIPLFLNAWGPSLLLLLYLVLAEGLAGTSVGKYHQGLRVVGPRGEPVTAGRGVARALIKTVPVALAIRVATEGPALLMWLAAMGGMLVLLLSTLLTGKDYRGFHERITGTRVARQPTLRLIPAVHALTGRLLRSVRRLRPKRRPARAATPSVAPPAVAPEILFGNYTPQRKLHDGESGVAWLGDDRLLHRQVLIVQHAPGRSRLGEERRAVTRLARLRWIGTGGSEQQPWDVFDYPALTRSLWETLPARRKLPWREARRVIGHLAAELDAGLRDGTLPPVLSLSQLVVGGDGTVTLLDVPLEHEGVARAERLPSDPRGIVAFLRVLVATLVTGRAPSATEAEQDRKLMRLAVRDHVCVRALWNPPADLSRLLAPMAHDLLRETSGNLELTAGIRLKQIFVVCVLVTVTVPTVVIVASETTRNASSIGPGVTPAVVMLMLFAVSGALFRGGAILRLDGIEVGLLDGRRAGRVRCLLRSLVAGSAVGLIAGFAGGGAATHSALFLTLALMLVPLGQAVACPSRSLADIVARTYLRPKAPETPGR